MKIKASVGIRSGIWLCEAPVRAEQMGSSHGWMRVTEMRVNIDHMFEASYTAEPGQGAGRIQSLRAFRQAGIHRAGFIFAMVGWCDGAIVL